MENPVRNMNFCHIQTYEADLLPPRRSIWGHCSVSRPNAAFLGLQQHLVQHSKKEQSGVSDIVKGRTLVGFSLKSKRKSRVSIRWK